MNLKIGIIGTNFISDDFCDAAKQTDGIELYAVYSRSSDTGTEFADRHNIPAVFTDYDDFLDLQIDAVYVASQTSPTVHNPSKQWNTKSMFYVKK